MALALATGPLQPKKRKVVKAPAYIDTTDEEYGDMAPAPASGPSQPKRKVVKTLAIIDIMDEYSLVPGPLQLKKRKVVKTPACIDMTEDEQYSYFSFIYLFFFIHFLSRPPIRTNGEKKLTNLLKLSISTGISMINSSECTN